MELMLLLVVVGTSIWVLYDASNLGIHKGLVPGNADYGPGAWFTICLLLWIIGFPCYLHMRPKFIAALERERQGGIRGRTIPPRRVITPKRRTNALRDIKFKCEACGQSLEAPPDMEGEVLECPKCKTAIIVQRPPETKKCPFCAEEIQYEAIKCKHCGEMLATR